MPGKRETGRNQDGIGQIVLVRLVSLMYTARPAGTVVCLEADPLPSLDSTGILMASLILRHHNPSLLAATGFRFRGPMIEIAGEDQEIVLRRSYLSQECRMKICVHGL